MAQQIKCFNNIINKVIKKKMQNKNTINKDVKKCICKQKKKINKDKTN